MRLTTSPSTRLGAHACRYAPHVLALLLTACGTPDQADAAENWMLSTPQLLPSPINLSNSLSATPWLSADGSTLYFASDRPGGYGKFDLWVATRDSAKDNWGEPVNLGPNVNTAAPEAMPCLSSDGLTLYFGDGNPFNWIPRNGMPGNFQIWTATRATQQSPWNVPTELGPPVGTTSAESYPHISRDGLSLYFTSTRSSPFGLHVAHRATPTAPWLTPTNLGSTFNQGPWTGFPFLSSNALHLLCYSDRVGGLGGHDLWISTRSTVTNAWPAPVNLGPQVNSAFYEVSPCVSADFPALGSSLLFARNDINGWNSRFKIYRAVVIPSLSLLRSSSLEGPWNPVDASFVPLSEDTIQAELSSDPRSSLSFFRLTMAGNTGSVRIMSAEKAGNRFRVRFQWIR
jgi:hypothetical protein